MVSEVRGEGEGYNSKFSCPHIDKSSRISSQHSINKPKVRLMIEFLMDRSEINRAESISTRHVEIRRK